MTKRTRNNFALSLLALAASGITAQAADFGTLKVSVPFAFRAGTVVLPAGNYSFIQENQAGLLRIAGSARSIMLITHPGQTVVGNVEPSVAFHKGSGVAVLEQLRLAGDAAAIVPVSTGR